MKGFSKQLFCTMAALLASGLIFLPARAMEPDSFIIIEIASDQVLINPALEALYQNNRLFIPFSYLTKDLSLPLSYNNTTQHITGWIETESNSVLVDLATHTGRVGKRMFDFSADDFLTYEGELFLQQDLIDKIAGTYSVFRFDSQTLHVKTAGNLPFEKELSRRQKQARFDRLQEEKEEARRNELNREIYTQKDWLQPPFLDLSARYSVSKNNHNPTVDTLGYSANASFLTGGFDSEFNIFSSSDSIPPSITLKTTKIDEDGHILGLFKQLEIGDIYAFSNAENAASTTGWGIKMSTESALQAEGKTYTLRDTLPLGWEVELYRNDELLGYQNDSNNGYFEFADIPLLLGKNIFKLVFYGPQGQIKQKEETIFFNGNILDKGKTRLRLNYVNKNRYIIETRDQARASALGHNALFEIGHGITDNLTVNVSAIADSLELGLKYPPGDFYRKDKTFAAADLSLFTYGIYSSLGTVVDFERHAATLNYYAQTSLLEWDMVFEHTYFGDAVTSRNIIGTTFIKNDTNFRTNKTLSLGLLGDFPFSYSLRHFSVLSGETQTDHVVSLSKSLPRNIYLNASYHNSHWISGTRNERLSVAGNHIRGPWTLRSNLLYDLSFHRLSSVDFSVFRSLSTRLKAGGRYTYALRDASAHTYEGSYALNLNWSTKVGFISLEAGTSDRKNSYAFIGYNLSLLPDWRNHSVYSSSSKLHGTGALSALAFMDNNSNGVRDNDEPILPETDFNLKPHVNVLDNRNTHENGATVITHIPAYRTFEVSANTSNVQQTLSLLNAQGSKTVRIRPAQVVHMEFPIVGTGDIEGTVSLQTADGKKPSRGIIVQLYKDEQLVAQRISEYDGYYSFPQIPLGRYTLRLDPNQAQELELRLPAEISIDLHEFEQLEIKDISVLSTAKPQKRASRQNTVTPMATTAKTHPVKKISTQNKTTAPVQPATARVDNKPFVSKTPQAQTDNKPLVSKTPQAQTNNVLPVVETSQTQADTKPLVSDKPKVRATAKKTAAKQKSAQAVAPRWKRFTAKFKKWAHRSMHFFKWKAKGGAS